jgi:hypothetical protein
LLEGADWVATFCSQGPGRRRKTESPSCLIGTSLVLAVVVRLIMHEFEGNEAASVLTWLRQSLKI